MAIPSEVNTGGQIIHKTAANLLFERLPDRIFAPLASTNRFRYWALLCHIHNRKFGPDAPLPPSNGFPSKEIHQEIEDSLFLIDSWEADDGEEQTVETSPSQQAYIILNRLVDSGWLKIDTFGLEKRVTMRPPVSKFLTLMVTFAETGPVYLSGKIRSIDLNIQQVLDGNADGDTLVETAEQARSLLEHVRNTGTNVRDIMEKLSQENVTSKFLKLFVDEYIEEVFIGDYNVLKTKEHPLSKRNQIIRAVKQLQETDQHRNRLIAWYESSRCNGDRKRAEMLFEKDIQKILDLHRIDEYLGRLDDEIRLANRRAAAYLDYRTRSLRPVEHLIKNILSHLTENSLLASGDPFPSDELISGEGLAEPRRRIERPPPSTLRRAVPSEAQVAKANVMLRARDARAITPEKLKKFVKQQIMEVDHISSQSIKLDSIPNIRSFQALSVIGMKSNSASRRLQLDAKNALKGYVVKMDSSIEVDDNGISGHPFIVEPSSASKKKNNGAIS